MSRIQVCFKLFQNGREENADKERLSSLKTPKNDQNVQKENEIVTNNYILFNYSYCRVTVHSAAKELNI
jgi:hypothetical protein